MSAAPTPRDGISRYDLPVGQAGFYLTFFIVEGANSGPTLALLGGVHGDEYEGPVTLSNLLAAIDPRQLSGKLIVAPALNVDALSAYTRCSPSDGLNLARVFPGNAGGTYTQILAALVREHVIAPADAVIDLHSGGTALDGVFFAGYTDEPNGVGDKACELAAAFGAPVVWRHDAPNPPGRTMSAAGDLGIPGIYIEAAGGPFPAREILKQYADGVWRALAHLDMYPDQVTMGLEPIYVEGSGDLDTSGSSPVSGICTPHIAPFDRVEPGRLMFTITDLDGAILHEVKATIAGLVMFRRRNRWVRKDETLYALATETG